MKGSLKATPPHPPWGKSSCNRGLLSLPKPGWHWAMRWVLKWFISMLLVVLFFFFIFFFPFLFPVHFSQSIKVRLFLPSWFSPWEFHTFALISIPPSPHSTKGYMFSGKIWLRWHLTEKMADWLPWYSVSAPSWTTTCGLTRRPPAGALPNLWSLYF